MGIPVLVLGESGSGKSASMRNFTPNEVGVFNVASKPLPFRTKLPKVDKANYQTIMQSLRNAKLNKYVVDDSQYLMAFEMFAKSNEAGYAKYTTCALNFYNLIQCVIWDTPEDCIVYFLHHTDRGDDGHVKAKTQGKMLDNQLTLEGMFSIVLLATTDGKEHKFLTQSDGTNPCKSPMEMLPYEMDNDLAQVDKAIRDYYGFGEKKERKEKQQ